MALPYDCLLSLESERGIQKVFQLFAARQFVKRLKRVTDKGFDCLASLVLLHINSILILFFHVFSMSDNEIKYR